MCNSVLYLIIRVLCSGCVVLVLVYCLTQNLIIMAKLKSIFNIEGTLGEMTFFKKRNGSYFIKQKSSISRERVLTDPRFARTRENGAEFGTVAQSAKLVRKGAAMLIGSAKDPSLTRRLVALFAKVKRMDSRSDRGKRNVYEGC